MKNKIQLLKIVFTIALMSVCKNNYAQFTASTNYAQAGAGVNVSPSNTGNDVLYDINTSNTYRVSVYGDLGGTAAPGLAWDVGGTTGDLVFASSSLITHADVWLVYNGSSVSAITAWYYSGSPNTVYLQEYAWGAGTFTLTNSTFWNVTVSSALNIDGDIGGKFVIVYDDPNNDIWAISGTGSGGLSLNNVNPTQLTLSTATGTTPDVSVFNLNGDAHVTYIGNTGNLYVEDYTFSSLISSPASSTGGWATSPAVSFYFSNPRIASGIVGNPSDYTVVVSATDHMGTYNIFGFNGNATSTVIDYNTGGTYSYYAFNGVDNSNPVVTYDYNGNVWVGWVMNNISNTVGGTAVDAQYPIVVQCDNVAQPGSAYPYYWEVPDNASLSSSDAYYAFSMAGRFGNDELFFTYYYAGNQDIYTKSATSLGSIGNFRKWNVMPTQTANTFYNALLSIPANRNATFKLFNLSGKLVLQESGTTDKIRTALNNANATMSRSVYLATVIADDGAYNISKKIFIGR